MVWAFLGDKHSCQLRLRNHVDIPHPSPSHENKAKSYPQNANHCAERLISHDCLSHDCLDISIHNNLSNLEVEWRQLEKKSNITIYQRFDWIATSINTIESETNSQPLIIAGHRNGELIFIVPLAIQGGWIKKISWIGGSHSNFNLVLIDDEFAKTLNNDEVRLIFRQMTRMLPGIGLLKLCSQPGNWEGQVNPLLALPHQRSTNDAFAIDLSKGFSHVLASGNGKRKRKKFRYQLRVVEKFGGAKLVQANTPEEALKILHCFHRQKTISLRNKGLPDVFGGRDAQLFLRQLALNSLGHEAPILRLYALKIGGKYRAISGGGVQENHFSTYFISYSDDELAHISPGEMLLYMQIKQLADTGFQSMDLGGGDERFKRSWCSNKIEMFDIILPLSKWAYGHVWIYRFLLMFKRQLRKYPPLWNRLKRLRIALGKFS